MLSKIKNIVNNIEFIDFIVIVFYYEFVYLGLLSVIGAFSQFFVLLGLLPIILFILVFFSSINWPKQYWWLFILVPIVSAGFGYFQGFFSGDAYGWYLPTGRQMVMDHNFPNSLYIFKYCHLSPFFPLLIGATFAIFNNFNEFFCLWIPFFFSSATVMLLYIWLKGKKNNNDFLFLIPLLFLTNVLVANLGWNLLYESVVLFFGTAFFYYYEKYQTEQKLAVLLFLFLSFVLAAVSKLSGLFLAPLILYLFFRAANKRQFLFYGFIFLLPLMAWLLRNYLLFDNPIFPVLPDIFRGRYYEIIKHSGYFLNPGLAYLQSLSARYVYTIKGMLFAFPFIFLAFYGFIKAKRYDYLVYCVIFFLLKEYLLFSANSYLRYYYILLGLLIVYALIGLEKLKSRLIVGILMIVGISGLLFIPFVESTSNFISAFEHRLLFFRDLLLMLSNYWYLTIIFLLPFVYLASRRKDVKIFLIFIYSLYVLYVEFIYNKSWLNTWLIIFLALALLIIFSLAKRNIPTKKMVIAFISLTIILNSWAMGSIYYWRHGQFSFPVSFLYEGSHWARKILDGKNAIAAKPDFFVLVTTQADYYYWFSDYRPVELGDFQFNSLTNLKYNNDLSAENIRQILIDAKIKYIIKNSDNLRTIYIEPNVFLDKVKNDNQFELIANKDDQVFVWQVY